MNNAGPAEPAAEDPVSPPMAALAQAARALGGYGRLAAALGLRASTVSMWRSRGQVPPVHCAQIERVTAEAGATVRRWALRPDDWAAIWPELRQAQGAPEAADAV